MPIDVLAEIIRVMEVRQIDGGLLNVKVLAREVGSEETCTAYTIAANNSEAAGLPGKIQHCVVVA